VKDCLIKGFCKIMQRENVFTEGFLGDKIFNRQCNLLTSDFMEVVNPPLPVKKIVENKKKKVEKDLKKIEKEQ
jgi:hypothetical protein